MLLLACVFEGQEDFARCTDGTAIRQSRRLQSTVAWCVSDVRFQTLESLSVLDSC